LEDEEGMRRNMRRIQFLHAVADAHTLSLVFPSRAADQNVE